MLIVIFPLQRTHSQNRRKWEEVCNCAQLHTSPLPNNTISNFDNLLLTDRNADSIDERSDSHSGAIGADINHTMLINYNTKQWYD